MKKIYLWNEIRLEQKMDAELLSYISLLSFLLRLHIYTQNGIQVSKGWEFATPFVMIRIGCDLLCWKGL